ncbi:efflux RND transporter permease subunit [Coxiella-like endosymbiont]|uniref:efflux RND transporter permease subunit n=1 Tax=Coxiella-like endosymbiont TaxID=1592897 RepID=UPI003F6F53FA
MIAMTITLAVIYVSIRLMHNQIASIFRSFTFILAGAAVIISRFITLTFSPMMCSRFLKVENADPKGYSIFIEKFYERIANGYQKILGKYSALF